MSSASWYFLNVFGLRSIYSLILGADNSADQTRGMTQQMSMQGGGPMGKQPNMKQIFKVRMEEWISLSLSLYLSSSPFPLISPSLPLSLSPSPHLCISFSLPFPLSLYVLSLSLSVYTSPSISLTPSLSLTPLSLLHTTQDEWEALQVVQHTDSLHKMEETLLEQQGLKQSLILTDIPLTDPKRKKMY